MLKACDNMAAKKKEKLEKAFNMISQDVSRTDRDLAPFKEEGSVRLSMIETILKVWVHQHMRIGYMQGLNDMQVPLLLTFFPTCTDDWTPLDKKRESNEPGQARQGSRYRGGGSSTSSQESFSSSSRKSH